MEGMEFDYRPGTTITHGVGVASVFIVHGNEYE